MTMGEPRLYLDHNATTPLLPEAREALMVSIDAANPSSVHAEGRRARAIVENARRDVAALLCMQADNLVFTSGASEAAATVLSPQWLVGGQLHAIARLAVLDTDHACLREGGAFSDDAVTRLPVDTLGVVDFDALLRWVRSIGDGETALLAITHANSETGVVQPLARIAEAIAGTRVLFVVDAAQSAGRLACEWSQLDLDAVFLSGHKLGAPKGIGAVAFAADATRPLPLIRGGGQESGRRAGTLPVGLIAAFGAAAKAAAREAAVRHDSLLARREHLENRLRETVRAVSILGETTKRLPQTVAVAVPGLSAETALMALDLDGFAVSAGSACSSGKVGRSHVVEAMVRGGLAINPDDGAIRVSFGSDTSIEDLDRFVDRFAAICARQRPGEQRNQAA